MCVSACDDLNKTVDYSAEAENRNVFFSFVFYQINHRYYIARKNKELALQVPFVYALSFDSIQ